MDTNIVLNLTTDDQAPVVAAKNVKKGGRWTDRLKARRDAKRKPLSADSKDLSKGSREDGPPPAKKLRMEETKSNEHARPPTQIISSLFTHNPPVEVPVQNAPPKSASKPSNAPLDGSSFTGLGLDPLITAHLNNKMNIHKPTSIQHSVLSSLLSTRSQENSARDVFIQSETGSGKTLSFLLPVLQDLLPLSSHSYIDRSIGTLAIIIAPTRELAKQISEVLDTLLKLRLRPEDDAGDDDNTATRMTRWLVSGLLIGGATRTHEKARLRKGIPILVSTPGRLLDHLQKTSSFNVGKCRWLILDEADRLMELGFEETITGIIKSLSGRRRLALQAAEEGKSTEVGGWDWEQRQRTILCSATIREDVQKLAGTVLHNPLVIKATKSDQPSNELFPKPANTTSPVSEKFTPPSQLLQKFVVVPLKLRLVGLVALLRSLLAKGRRGSKIIVFMSCTDSVDFHWRLIGASSLEVDEPSSIGGNTSDEAEASEWNLEQVKVKSSLLPGASIYRLHGSLSTKARLSALRGFSTASAGKPKTPTAAGSSILFCTSVASRGLDLPLVRAIIQYDLPTEGGTTEYLHRVGRTARAGKGGEAWSVVAPSEVEWVKWTTERMTGNLDASAKPERHPISFDAVTIENLLADGFGGEGREYEKRATEVQLSFEHWVLLRQEHLDLARKAFLSHIRAYATHSSAEKHIFHVRHLHLGHLAKSFALREAPTAVTKRGVKSPKNKLRKGGAVKAKTKRPHDVRRERRTRDMVHSQGRLPRKGSMASSGASEFQLLSGAVLEKLVPSDK